MEINHTRTQLNKEKNRFELKLDQAIAFIDFKIGKAGDIYLIHTEVPPAFKGKGVGHKLVRESLEIVEEDGCLMIPICPFVRSFILSNREDYKNILSPKAKLNE
jgi:uncharacterized protein